MLSNENPEILADVLMLAPEETEETTGLQERMVDAPENRYAITVTEEALDNVSAAEGVISPEHNRMD